MLAVIPAHSPGLARDILARSGFLYGESFTFPRCKLYKSKAADEYAIGEIPHDADPTGDVAEIREVEIRRPTNEAYAVLGGDVGEKILRVPSHPRALVAADSAYNGAMISRARAVAL